MKLCIGSILPDGAAPGAHPGIGARQPWLVAFRAGVAVIQVVDELDPSTLTALLKDSEVTNGANVVSVERRPVGTGQVASCWELTLGIEGRTELAAVVAKVPSGDPVSLATATAQHLYEREVRFYQLLAPLVVVRTPRCHHASFDEATGGFLLLLESMAPSAEADQLDGLAVARAELALRELAGLHAPLWDAPGLDAITFVQDVAASLRPLYLEIVPALFDAFLERYGDLATPTARGVVEWLRPRLGTYFEGREGPQTVVHGDYRSDNLLFDGRGGEVPLAVVDWQTVAHGSGALDAAYLLTTSLTTDVRRAEERRLLAVYLERLGELGVADVGFDALFDDYVWHAFQGIVMLVCASMIVARTDRGDGMFLTMIERISAAVEDLDARRALEH
jgi:aminoglycoside/choline kinase family phosphotransferase